jgi:RNA polymerase-binding protein DksA
MVALEKRMRMRLEEDRSLLREELEQLRQEVRAEDLEIGGDNTPLSEPADRTQAGLVKEARAEKMGRLLVRLASIDDALARLKRGEYGFCTWCGSAIPRKRLEAVPEASLCVACKKQAEGAEEVGRFQVSRREPGGLA